MKRHITLLIGLLIANLMISQDFAFGTFTNHQNQQEKSEVVDKEFTKSLNEFSFQVLMEMGKENDESQKHHVSVEIYSRAIKLNKKAAIAYDKRAVAYIYLGKYRKAIKDLTRAIRLEPEFVEAYNHRGNVNYYSMNLVTAIKDYTKAIELRPKYGKAYYNRGICFLKLGEIELAYKDLKTALTLNYAGAEDLIWNHCSDRLLKVPNDLPR
ncbi:MAG: tetratricopeptide repeat protein [Bacteroidota bacterium]